MGEVIRLDEYRAARRQRLPDDLERLDHAIARLDPLVRRASGRLRGPVERELACIARAVTVGRPREAIERAERLADRLEHPAALA
jgi:hypothetical protein